MDFVINQTPVRSKGHRTFLIHIKQSESVKNTQEFIYCFGRVFQYLNLYILKNS